MKRIFLIATICSIGGCATVKAKDDVANCITKVLTNAVDSVNACVTITPKTDNATK